MPQSNILITSFRSFDGINSTHYTSLPADRPQILIEFSTVPFISANGSAVTTWVSLVQPEGSARVGLRSNNYQNNPVITSKFYSTAADKVAILYGYKKLRQVLGWRAVRIKMVKEFHPAVTVSDTGDEIWKAIQDQPSPPGHPPLAQWIWVRNSTAIGSSRGSRTSALSTIARFHFRVQAWA